MKQVELTQSKTAFIDDDMFDLVGSYKWQYDQKTGYAKRKFTIDGKRKTVYLHKMIFEYATGEKLNGKTHVVDHENNIRTDCRMTNLRKATYSQNNVNKVTKTNKTGKRGVKQHGMKFVAVIQFEGVKYKSDKFDTADEASNWFYAKASELDSEFFKGIK